MLLVDTKDMADPWMELRYIVTSRETDETEAIATRVALTTTPLPWGGVRWWFLCPICGRRCGKLHLGSEGVEFACRICGRLTYRSCQESSRLNDRIPSHEANVGITYEADPDFLEHFHHEIFSGEQGQLLWDE